jgi:hypothetical protein
MGMVCWVAAALPLGGYIGYKMGGDRQNSERASRSVATFWRIIGLSMFLFFCLPPPVLILVAKTRLFGAKGYHAMAGFWVNVCLPIFIFGVVPLSLVIWIWQRRQRTVPERALGGPISAQSPRSVTNWVALAMTVALICLALFCWASSLISASHFPKARYVSTSEVQSLIANSQVQKFRFELFQSASGARMLSGDLIENGKMSPFVAPAENSTMALLAEKGISYETKIENRDSSHLRMTLAGRCSERLLNPFCCFILVAGAGTLLRGSHNRQSGPHSITDLRNERRVDTTFAALAACGMVALAVFRGVTTDWKVRTISAYQVPAIVAEHKNARFEVFEYMDGSRKLWISDLRNPDFIAPADESTLRLLARQGITYQTYVAGQTNVAGQTYVAGTAGVTGRGQSTSVLWMLVLAAGAGSLFGWAVKSRPVSPSRIQAVTFD